MAAWPQNSIGRRLPRHRRPDGSEPRDVDGPSGQAKGPAMAACGRSGKNGSNRFALCRRPDLGFPAWARAADKPRLGVVSDRFAPHLLMKSDLFECHRIARGLLHSRSAFGIGLPLTASIRRHLGCGCSSVVEHDLAKVGVEGSSPFARSRFSSMADYRIDDRPPLGGLVVCGAIRT